MPQKMKAIIEALGTSQNQVALLAGLSYGDFNLIVNGRIKKPKLSQARLVVEVLRQLAQSKQLPHLAEGSKLTDPTSDTTTAATVAAHTPTALSRLVELQIADVAEFQNVRDDRADVPGQTVAERRNLHKRLRRGQAKAKVAVTPPPTRNYRMSEAAERMGVQLKDLREWDREGTFKPEFLSPGGHRFYTKAQIQAYLTLTAHQSSVPESSPTTAITTRKKTYLYVNVPATKGQYENKLSKDLSLEREEQAAATLRQFAEANEIVFDEILVEVTGGRNGGEQETLTTQQRPYFQRLMQQVLDNQVTQVVTVSKEMLAPTITSFDLIAQIFKQHGANIILQNQSTDQLSPSPHPTSNNGN